MVQGLIGLSSLEPLLISRLSRRGAHKPPAIRGAHPAKCAAAAAVAAVGRTTRLRSRHRPRLPAVPLLALARKLLTLKP